MMCCKYGFRISKLSVVTLTVIDADRTTFIVMLNVFMLSVIMLGDVPPFS
jgi:hypothetical protein